MRENIVMTSINYVKGTRTERVVGRTWRRPAVTKCIELDDHAEGFLQVTEQEAAHPLLTRLLAWTRGATYGQMWDITRRHHRLL